MALFVGPIHPRSPDNRSNIIGCLSNTSTGSSMTEQMFICCTTGSAKINGPGSRRRRLDQESKLEREGEILSASTGTLNMMLMTTSTATVRRIGYSTGLTLLALIVPLLFCLPGGNSFHWGSNVLPLSTVWTLKRMSATGGHSAGCSRLCIFPTTQTTTATATTLLYAVPPQRPRKKILSLTKVVPCTMDSDHSLSSSSTVDASTGSSGNAGNLLTTTKETTERDLQQQQVTKKRKQKRAVAEDYQLELSMMNHDLLTKEMEQELAQSLQRSRQLQARLDSLIAEKKLEKAADDFESGGELLQSSLQEEEEEDDADFDSNDAGDGDADWLNSLRLAPEQQQQVDRSVRISETRREYNAVVAEYGWHPSSVKVKSALLEHLDQQSRTTQASLLGEDNANETPITIKSSFPTPNILNNSSVNAMSADSIVTEEDIIQILQLPGGRTEMEAIFMEGARARDTLIRGNLRLVSSICKRWSRMSMGRDSTDSLFALYSGGWDRPSLSEAVQEGVIGLTVAAERFNPARGLRFSTYATYWITNSVRQCFQRATTGCFRLPINYYDARTRYKTLVRDYYQRDGFIPSVSVLARDMGMSEKRLQLILRLTQPLLSTDGPLMPMGLTKAGKAGNINRVEDSIPISDMLVDSMDMNPEDRVELSLLRLHLENAMAAELLPIERDVLRLRLGLDDGVMRTCREVSQEFGGRWSSLEIRTTEKRALKKLGSPVALATYKLLAFLDFADVDLETVKFR